MTSSHLPLRIPTLISCCAAVGALFPVLSLGACSGEPDILMVGGSGGMGTGGSASGGTAPSGGAPSTGGESSGGLGGGDPSMGGEPGEPQGSGGFGPGPEAPGFCESDKDCRDQNQICDVERMVCVDCLGDADCGDGAECSDFVCESFVNCESTLQCEVDEVCDGEQGVCVECVRDQDCADGEVCFGQSCQAACDSDKDCRELGQLCLIDQGVCVECTKDADCGAEAYCSEANLCLDAVCDAGETFCEGDRLLTCGPRGLSFSARPCRNGCGADEDGAFCTSSTSGKCAGTDADICARVAPFVGSQDVDGDPEDFCDVPAMEFDFESAEFKVILDESVDTKKSRATVRLGWDELALRAHIHVRDDAVMHSGGQIYDGDNVQIFFSGAAPLESSIGNTINGGSQQLLIAPAMGERPARDEISPGDGPRDYEVATRLVDDGYEIEVMMPWVDVVPQVGQKIGFDLLIGVQDTEGGRDFEYGMALKDIEASQCGQGNEALWCDARHWCSPSAE